MTDGNLEKRLYPRVQAPVYISCDELSKEPLAVEDISATGLRVRLQNPPPASDRVTLDVHLPNAVLIGCQGVIVHKDGQPGAPPYEVGIQLFTRTKGEFRFLNESLAEFCGKEPWKEPLKEL